MDSDTETTASPDGVHVNVSVHVTGEIDEHPLEALRGLSNGMGMLEHALCRTGSQVDCGPAVSSSGRS